MYHLMLLQQMDILGLTGGGLEDEYEVWQFHAHWGDDDCRGSEHTVDGQMYPGEVSIYSIY